MNAYDDLARLIGIDGPSPLTAAMEALLYKRADGAIGRARESGLSYDPDLRTMFREMYVAQQGRCTKTRLPFSLVAIANGGRAPLPFSPSPDRLDCAAGYVRGNVRLVLQGVNFARDRWGDDVLITIAIALVYADTGEPL